MFWLGVACLLAGLAAAWMVLQEPWLGIQLQVSDAGDRVVVAETDPRSSPAVPRNAQVLRIGSAGGQFLNIETSDLIEEPDFFDTYAAMEEFFDRQSAIASMLRMGVVTLVWRDENGNDIATQIHPRSRTLSSIPAIFWFQLGVGFTALLMAAWIFVLRPDYWGARLFALTGLAFPLFTV
ncbi:MAG: histidine kinase, partial [Rhodoferax sp.]|nr:histidine kinase [Rhodoferax sp.]